MFTVPIHASWCATGQEGENHGGLGQERHRGASVVVRLQEIVARELSPYEAAVVTVGSFHAGTRANIIPPEAVLEVTVRAMSEATLRQILASIERIVRAGSQPRARV